MADIENRKSESLPEPPIDNLTISNLNDFLEVQKKDIELRIKEIEIHKQELAIEQQKDQNAFSFSNEAMKKQFDDRKDFREKHFKYVNSLRQNILFVVFALIILFGYAIFMDKANIVIEALKILGSTAIGIFGGYHYGKSKIIKNLENEEKE